MKKVSQVFMLLSLVPMVQSCSTNSVENDFSYESLSDTVGGTPFRNRKFDYARVKVAESPSLKIPTGLNGEKIKPALKLPEGENKYAKSQVDEAEKEMLPPNYADKFDMTKIISDQISKVSISVVYDDSGALKLVFREPVSITINLLKDYFDKHSDMYSISSEEDEMLSGHLIKVKDTKDDLVYVIKARKVDELSSLVKVNMVYEGDGETQSSNYVDEGVSLLSAIRKELNNTELKNDNNIQIAKQAEADMSKPDFGSDDGKSSLGGLFGGTKKSSFSLSSYDRTINAAKQKEQQDTQSSQDLTQQTAPSDDSVYDSDAQAQELNI